MWGSQASCLHDGLHSPWKENTLNVCSRQDFIPITCYSGSDTQGNEEIISNYSFTCIQFDMVQILNDCTRVT